LKFSIPSKGFGKVIHKGFQKVSMSPVPLDLTAPLCHTCQEIEEYFPVCLFSFPFSVLTFIILEVTIGIPIQVTRKVV